MSASFRTRQIAVTSAHYDALSALAEINGCDCADTFAETLLAKALAAEGQVDWLLKERKKQREALTAEYMRRLITPSA